jgi:DoxX-like family
MMTAGLVTGLIVIATIAGVRASRREDVAPEGPAALMRSVAYWLLTLVVAFELAAGALWDLLRIEYVRVVLAHLGYPMYLLIIIGVWRIPGALALLVPRFPRLKEWAYAGAFFNYTGAAASHFLAGDSAGKWVGPLVLAVFTLISWALRPASRRLPRERRHSKRVLAGTVVEPLEDGGLEGDAVVAEAVVGVEVDGCDR